MPRLFLCFLLALLVFAAFLGRANIVTDHEARVVLTAQTMAAAGWPWNAVPVTVEPSAGRTSALLNPNAPVTPTTSAAVPQGQIANPKSHSSASLNPWLVPVYRGQIRLQKPPLPYWCTAIAFKLIGETPFAARLTPALLGAFATLLIRRLARLTAGRVVAGWAAGVWVSTYFIADEFRKAMADPYLAFFALAALTAYLSLVSYSASPKTDFGNRKAICLSLLLLYLALALGSLSKGPVLFLHVGLGAAAYSVAFRRFPAIRHWPAHLLGLALFSAIALPWPLYILTHLPDALELWRFESVGEFTDNTRNARPLAFYLLYLPFFPLPWVLPCFVGFALALRHRRRGAAPPTPAFPNRKSISENRRRSSSALFLLIWTGTTLFIFSLAHMKKIAYLLPLTPAFTLATALGIAHMLRLARRRWGEGRLARLAGAHAVVSLGLAIVICAMIVRAHRSSDQWPALLMALAIGVLPLVFQNSLSLRGRAQVQIVAFSLLLMLFLAFPAADRDNRRPPAALGETSRAERQWTERP